MTFYTKEEIYTQPLENRRILWFIYYELVSAVSSSILIIGLISAWELVFRDIFLK